MFILAFLMLCFTDLEIFAKKLETKANFDARKHPNWPKETEDICGTSLYSDRIVGGKATNLGQFPWQARLGYIRGKKISYDCGGALITKKFVLTAKHCLKVNHDIQLYNVILGEWNIETDPDCVEGTCADPIQIHFPSAIYIQRDHENDGIQYKFDIGLIKLKSNVTFTDFICPICLPFGDMLERAYLGEYAQVAGWGYVNPHKKKVSAILQVVELPIVGIEKCEELYSRHNIELRNDSQICAGGEMGHDSCSGDSGNALLKPMASDIGSRYFAIGIVSFGTKSCGRDKKAAVYTRVSHYMPWLLDRIQRAT